MSASIEITVKFVANITASNGRVQKFKDKISLDLMPKYKKQLETTLSCFAKYKIKRVDKLVSYKDMYGATCGAYRFHHDIINFLIENQK